MRSFVYPLIITLMSAFVLVACDKSDTSQNVAATKAIATTSTGFTHGWVHRLDLIHIR